MPLVYLNAGLSCSTLMAYDMPNYAYSKVLWEQNPIPNQAYSMIYSFSFFGGWGRGSELRVKVCSFAVVTSFFGMVVRSGIGMVLGYKMDRSSFLGVGIADDGLSCLNKCCNAILKVNSLSLRGYCGQLKGYSSTRPMKLKLLKRRTWTRWMYVFHSSNYCKGWSKMSTVKRELCKILLKRRLHLTHRFS